jgi:hypothetical protein
MRTQTLVFALFAAGCAAHAPTTAPAHEEAAKTPEFIEDDLNGALEQAKAQGKPLFVDAWAPW